MPKKDTKTVTPLGDKVLLQEIEAQSTTAAGIILPQSLSKEQNGMKEAEVISVGPGRTEEGKEIPVQVKKGDTVLFQWGDEVTIDGEKYFLVSEGNIAAIVK